MSSKKFSVFSGFGTQFQKRIYFHCTGGCSRFQLCHLSIQETWLVGNYITTNLIGLFEIGMTTWYENPIIFVGRLISFDDQNVNDMFTRPSDKVITYSIFLPDMMTYDVGHVAAHVSYVRLQGVVSCSNCLCLISYLLWYLSRSNLKPLYNSMIELFSPLLTKALGSTLKPSTPCFSAPLLSFLFHCDINLKPLYNLIIINNSFRETFAGESFKK